MAPSISPTPPHKRSDFIREKTECNRTSYKVQRIWGIDVTKLDSIVILTRNYDNNDTFNNSFLNNNRGVIQEKQKIGVNEYSDVININLDSTNISTNSNVELTEIDTGTKELVYGPSWDCDLLYIAGNYIVYLKSGVQKLYFLSLTECPIACMRNFGEYLFVAENGDENVQPIVVVYIITADAEDPRNFLSINKVLHGGSKDKFIAMDLNKNGNKLVTVAVDLVTVWDWKTEEIVVQLERTDSEEIQKVSFSNWNENSFVTSSETGPIFWTIEESLSQPKLLQSSGKFGRFLHQSIKCFIELNDGQYLSGHNDGYFYLWKSGTVQCKVLLHGCDASGLQVHKGGVSSLCHSLNNGIVYSTGFDGSIKLFHVDEFDVSKIKAKMSALGLAELVVSSIQIISVSNGAIAIQLWSFSYGLHFFDSYGGFWTQRNTKNELELQYNFHAMAIKVFAVSPSKEIVALSPGNKHIHIYNYQSNDLVCSYSMPSSCTSLECLPVALDPEGCTFVAGSEQGVLRFFSCSLKNSVLRRAIRPHKSSVTCIKFCPGSKYLMSASEEGVVFLLWIEFDSSSILNVHPIGMVSFGAPISQTLWLDSKRFISVVDGYELFDVSLNDNLARFDNSWELASVTSVSIDLSPLPQTRNITLSRENSSIDSFFINVDGEVHLCRAENNAWKVISATPLSSICPYYDYTSHFGSYTPFQQIATETNCRFLLFCSPLGPKVLCKGKTKDKSNEVMVDSDHAPEVCYVEPASLLEDSVFIPEISCQAADDIEDFTELSLQEFMDKERNEAMREKGNERKVKHREELDQIRKEYHELCTINSQLPEYIRLDLENEPIDKIYLDTLVMQHKLNMKEEVEKLLEEKECVDSKLKAIESRLKSNLDHEGGLSVETFFTGESICTLPVPRLSETCKEKLCIDEKMNEPVTIKNNQAIGNNAKESEDDTVDSIAKGRTLMCFEEDETISRSFESRKARRQQRAEILEKMSQQSPKLQSYEEYIPDETLNLSLTPPSPTLEEKRRELSMVENIIHRTKTELNVKVLKLKEEKEQLSVDLAVANERFHDIKQLFIGGESPHFSFRWPQAIKVKSSDTSTSSVTNECRFIPSWSPLYDIITCDDVLVSNEVSLEGEKDASQRLLCKETAYIIDSVLQATTNFDKKFNILHLEYCHLISEVKQHEYLRLLLIRQIEVLCSYEQQAEAIESKLQDLHHKSDQTKVSIKNIEQEMNDIRDKLNAEKNSDLHKMLDELIDNYEQSLKKIQNIEEEVNQLEQKQLKLKNETINGYNIQTFGVCLEAHQIQLASDSTESMDLDNLDDYILSSNEKFEEIRRRMVELDHGLNERKASLQSMLKHKRMLEAKVDDCEKSIETKKKANEDLQLLKFGQTVIDEVDSLHIDKVEILEADKDMKKIFSQQEKQLSDLKKNHLILKEQHLLAVNENTLLLNQLAHLTKRKMNMQEEAVKLKQTTGEEKSGFSSFSSKSYDDSGERKQFITQIENQSTYIEHLKQEIRALKRKDTNIVL